MLHDLNNRSIAVIDLGTNTFHMVIFQRKGDLVTESYRKRHHVFLSQEGIETIAESSIMRARTAIEDFDKTLTVHRPDSVKIIGTEALRVASNGPDLAKYIENTLQSRVEVISGHREANLIAKGVQWESKTQIENALIMDIGGGSVEFIHLYQGKVKWLESFPVGVGVLHNRFRHSEPVKVSELQDIEEFIEKACHSLLQYLKTTRIDYLIGASGSFELIPAIEQREYPPKIIDQMIAMDSFHRISSQILRSSLAERLEMKGLPRERAPLLVVAFILMSWIIRTMPAKQLRISKYAVKEGLVAEELLNF